VAADIEPIHSEVGTQTPYAANHILEVVRNMFNWGKVAGLIPREHPNPTLGIKWFPERQRRRYITTVEMPEFIRALEAEDNEYARHGLWLLLLTGLRSIELLKAKWADIDWDAGTLLVGLTKNGEPLLAPLSDAALARLKMIPRIANNPYIICGLMCGKPLTNFGHPLRRVLARAGLQNIRVHDLRRTVGSWLAQSGVSLHLIGDVLNHRDLRTTLGYAYFQTQQRRDVLNNHGGKVLSLAGEHLLESAQPTALSAENVLRPDAPPLRHHHYFRRESLHEIVWTAPVMEVAKRLGVSDVGLAKLCRRAAIPTPTRGYWARVESGQSVGRAPLPPAPEGLPTLLRIRGTEPAPTMLT
jgi:site-specific recombinase XerD